MPPSRAGRRKHKGEKTMRRKNVSLIALFAVFWLLFPWLACHAIGGRFLHNSVTYFDSSASRNNTAYQDQLGDENESQILQSGSFNNGMGCGKIYGASTIQVGSGNQVLISQNGANNCAAIHQSGNYNEATITQVNNNNYASIGQYGDFNTAGISQTGGDNIGLVEQYFSNNVISISQGGGNYASYVQYGNKSCQISQTPGAPPVTIIQQ